jgi:hypothetical protein
VASHAPINPINIDKKFSPITLHDRVASTFFNDEYWKDVRKLTDELKKTNPQELENKSLIWLSDSWVARKWQLPAVINNYERVSYWMEILEDKARRCASPIELPGIDQGRYLFMRVDLTETSEDLQRLFSIILEIWKKSDAPSRRNRMPKVDKWKIWHMAHREKKNCHQITRELFRLKEPAAYSPETDRRYKQVCAALKNAEEILDQVTREASNRTTIVQS